MIENIGPVITNIPEPLKIAAFQKKLVPFIGAGLSQIGGTPGWDVFANDVLKIFLDNRILTHAQLDQISRLTSSRIKLSIALELRKKHNIQIDFRALLLPTAAKVELGNRAYSNLSKLASTFVTTNYDEWLDAGRNVFVKPTEITALNLDVEKSVFHIHGSVTEPDNMVLTTLDYLNRYASHRIDGQKNHENPYLTFLETLFQLKNVIFIGYSLAELEILEYVLQKAVKPTEPEEPRHYVIQGFYNHEIELARSLESYYRSFGVGLLAFSKDERGWDQLEVVIEDLAAKLPPGRSLALPILQEMEGLL